MKLGIFGGTFNPIHFGHLRVAEEAREIAGLDRVIFIPSGNPPLKTSGLAPAKHRLEMARLAIRENPFFELSDIECRDSRKSFTTRTLEKLVTLRPHDSLYFMLGIDAFLDIPNWHKPDLLLAMTNFIILSRPGFRFTDLTASPYLTVKKDALSKLDAGVLTGFTAATGAGKTAALLNVSLIGISATVIRDRISQGKSVKYLLPADVESYIILKNVYKSGRRRDETLRRACR